MDIDRLPRWDLRRVLRRSGRHAGVIALGRRAWNYRVQFLPEAILVLQAQHDARRTQRLKLTYSQPGFGGQRWRVHCPLCRAQRDVLHAHAGQWACRGCLGLTYPRVRTTIRAARQ